MTKRVHRADDGKYHVGGHSYDQLVGSRAQVFHGTAYKTPGGLTKKQLVMNKWGRIVSRKKQKTARKEKRLESFGYFAKKGKFGWVKKEPKGTRKRRRKTKGARRRHTASAHTRSSLSRRHSMA